MRKHRFQKASSSRYALLGSQSLHPHPWLFQRSSLSSHCQVFLSTSSDAGKPQSSLLFGLCLPCGYFSQSLLTIEIVLGWEYRHSRVSKMPQAMQLACLAKPTARYHRSHMEIAKTGNQTAGSEVTSFPCHGRVSISSWCKKSLWLKGLRCLEYHSFTPTQLSTFAAAIQLYVLISPWL